MSLNMQKSLPSEICMICKDIVDIGLSMQTHFPQIFYKMQTDFIGISIKKSYQTTYITINTTNVLQSRVKGCKLYRYQEITCWSWKPKHKHNFVNTVNFTSPFYLTFDYLLSTEEWEYFKRLSITLNIYYLLCICLFTFFFLHFCPNL